MLCNNSLRLGVLADTKSILGRDPECVLHVLGQVTDVQRCAFYTGVDQLPGGGARFTLLYNVICDISATIILWWLPVKDTRLRGDG